MSGSRPRSPPRRRSRATRRRGRRWKRPSSPTRARRGSLLDFYRGAHHVGRPQADPRRAVASRGPLRGRLLRRERARDDRGAARRAEGRAGRRLGVPPADRRADDDRALARRAGRLRRAAGGGRAASIAAPRSSRRRPGSPRTSSAITRARSATWSSCSGCGPPTARSRRRSSACSNDTSAGPSWSRRGGSGWRCWPAPRPASCACASRPRCTRSSRSQTRRSPRCASFFPICTRTRRWRGCSKACSPTSARRPRRASTRSTPCACATRRPAPARACPTCSGPRSASPSGDRLRDLRRECGDRLHTLGDVSGALDQYVALIALAPEDRAIEDSLRQLAEAARDPGRLAAALATAAAACRRTANAAPSCWFARRASRIASSDTRSGPARCSRTRSAARPAPRSCGSRAFAGWRRSTTRSATRRGASTRSSGSRRSSPSRAASASPGRWPRSWRWSIGDVDRALGAWQARLALDPARRRGAGGGARCCWFASSAGRRSSSFCAGASRARRPPHQIRADLIEMATMARERLGDVGARDRALARGRHALRRRRRERRRARRPLHRERRASRSWRSCCRATPTSTAGHHADRLARLADAHRLQLGDARRRRSNGTGARWTSTPAP